MTTEERLYKLEGIVEGVMATVPERITALENRMDLLRQELKGDMVSLRQELKGEIAALRQEFKAEMASLRQELKGDINTAINRMMLYFTGLAVLLALLTLWR
ncbi:MAG: DUF1640 domain-containing protein [Thermus sp.]|uniref:DUF1640 domain-containing protein n=1 Tax=Thermus sp. TaxID=275 RepID=UPI0039187A16